MKSREVVTDSEETIEEEDKLNVDSFAVVASDLLSDSFVDFRLDF